jgi:hypothetical protein
MTNSKNQEIVKKFLASKAFDFTALGKFVSENGESIASSGDGEFGVVIGFRFFHYCIPPVVGTFGDGDPAEVRAEVTGR